MKEESHVTLPVLPMRGMVLYPHLSQTVAAGRAASVKAVEAAFATEEQEIFVVAQRDATNEAPAAEDLYTIGTRATIKKIGRYPTGNLQLVIQGVARGVLLKLEQTSPFMKARVLPFPMPQDGGTRIEALLQEAQELMGKILSLTRTEVPGDLRELLVEGSDPLRSAYTFASMLGIDLAREQALLEAPSLEETLSLLHTYLTHELRVLELRSEIADQARSEVSREQREYMLRQQLRAIQEELGEGGDGNDMQKLRERLSALELSGEARKELERELGRLEGLPNISPEHSTLRTYLEFALELPWSVSKTAELDLEAAKRVLDADHFGLDEVKQRILEHLGVLKLNPAAKAPILCFVGPPGVGKTSLGQSVARALGREFTRLSLGGLYDEAELRGHRRTYVGAMPGRILQAIRRAGVNNPVLMLDEVDKLGRDFRGDPAAALLEILDPEQNREFRDNYLNLPFDLSRVLFITTANTLETIPAPLLDRLEVIRLSGYSEEEKSEIARRYLIPRQLRESGLSTAQCDITDEAVHKVIAGYTREGGVRELERTLGKMIRKTALKVARGESVTVTIGEDDVSELLGPERFFLEKARKELPPGVATGLAWTPTGGDVLYIEASLLPDGEGLTLTGQLGDVMQESARTARSYVWAHADELGVDPKTFKRNGVHLHVPAGAIPKDGPSAGITIATALMSLYTHRRVRNDTAMTGEITLTGLVLPVGGIKEKVLAARRAGKRRVILSRENQKDLHDLPGYVKDDMEFIFVEALEDVLKEALQPCSRRSRLPKVG